MTDTLRIAPRTTRIALETPAGMRDFTLREMSLPERRAYHQAWQQLPSETDTTPEAYLERLKEVVRLILRLDGEGQAVTIESGWLDGLLLHPGTVDRLAQLQADLNTPAGPVGALIFMAALRQTESTAAPAAPPVPVQADAS
ncbi:MAG: hypothetical protein ACYCW6_21385 [Candidatus Xenobia bacterium]